MDTFDAICSSPENSQIQYHHCRGWDINPTTGKFQGCYGTNPNHGSTFEDACDELLQFLKRQYEFEREYDEDIAGELKKKIDYYQDLTYNKWIKDQEKYYE